MLETIVSWFFVGLVGVLVIATLIWAMRHARPRNVAPVPSGRSRQDVQNYDMPDEKRNRKKFYWGLFTVIGMSLIFSLGTFLIPPISVKGHVVWSWGWFFITWWFDTFVVYPLIPLWLERGETGVMDEEGKDQDVASRVAGRIGDFTLKQLEERMKSEKYPILESTDWGALWFAGEYLFRVKAGFKYLPPFATLVRSPKGRLQFQIPGRSEDLWLNEPKDCPKGKVLPIFFTLAGKPGSSSKGEEVEPLERQLTLKGSVQGVIEVDGSQLYVFQTKFFKNLPYLEQVAKDILSGCSLAVLGSKNPAEVIRTKKDVDAEIARDFADAVEGMGVVGTNASFPDLVLGRTVSEELQNVSAEQLKAQATVIKAAAEKKKRELEGQGEASKEQSIGDAKTAVLVKRKDNLGVGGGQVLGAETASDVAKNVKDLTVLDGSIGSETFRFGKLFDRGAKSNEGGDK
jgi:hypothetical protein